MLTTRLVRNVPAIVEVLWVEHCWFHAWDSATNVAEWSACTSSPVWLMRTHFMRPKSSARHRHYGCVPLRQLPHDEVLWVEHCWFHMWDSATNVAEWPACTSDPVWLMCTHFIFITARVKRGPPSLWSLCWLAHVQTIRGSRMMESNGWFTAGTFHECANTILTDKGPQPARIWIPSWLGVTVRPYQLIQELYSQQLSECLELNTADTKRWNRSNSWQERQPARPTRCG